MTNPAFITTIYGERYAPFLLPHLHSISTLYPESHGVVLWQDLPPREIELLSAGFPRFRFIRTEQSMSGDLHQRIPRKLHAWKEACALLAGHQPSALCFLDCDTLLVSTIDQFLQPGWDVTFTWKDELFPINTGVLLARNAEIAGILLSDLAQRVEYIVRDPGRLQTALGSSGAADQHALREIIGFCNYDREIVRTLAGRELVFRGVPCRQLNETNCRPMTPDLAIVHYKTGWHPILLDGAPFTRNRPADRCQQMFEHFRAMQRGAGRALTQRLMSTAAAEHLGRFAPLADGYEQRGILNSEMLTVCALCDRLGAEVIIESGRARGQSTWVLARYFQHSGRSGRPVNIASIELERDADAVFAEERLANFANVQLLYGDAFKMLPLMLKSLEGRRIAILLDGPKGAPAIELLRRCFAQSTDVVAGFIHDTRRGTPQRAQLEESAHRVFFTDDEEFVAAYSHLDRTCVPGDGEEITMHTWRPGMKGEDRIESYGPTLAILLPDAATAASAASQKSSETTAAESRAAQV
jgi:hypothetical protein